MVREGKEKRRKMVKECIKKTTKRLSAINLMTPDPIEWLQNGCRGFYPFLPIC